MSGIAAIAGRRWLAPEVVQTSVMDCGPAALASILQGFRIPASYGRLREACQTGVDGTSIDTLETVANRLGVCAEQVMLPPDQLFMKSGIRLPALLVVRQAAGPTHFVLAWRRVGDRIQVMDPAVGRRWLREADLLADLFRHEMSVPAADWRSWAAGPEFAEPMAERLAAVGIDRPYTDRLVAAALRDEMWFAAAALDAAARLVTGLVQADAVAAGAQAARLLTDLFDGTCANPHDIYALIPPDYWTVAPDPRSVALGERRVLLRGAVLLLLSGKVAREGRGAGLADDAPLLAELQAALDEKPVHPLRTLWQSLREDGLLAPLALLAALGLALGVSLLEALLFRGMIEIGQSLTLGLQRLGAAVAIVGLLAVMLAFRIPLIAESLRMGRRLDLGFRVALAAKLPHLPDRYFQSRPISDMADRAHSLYLSRQVPGLALHFMQLLGEMAIVLLGLAWLDPAIARRAIPLAFVAIAVPLLAQRAIAEAELRARSHSAALHGIMLDALQGQVPIRVHGAQSAVARLHEGLVSLWLRATRQFLLAGTAAAAVQQFICSGGAAAILIAHFAAAPAVLGSDLLLVYWVLKLPTLGQSLAALAQQYPAQRNILMRIMEPLLAPVDREADPAPASPRPAGAPVRLLRRAVHLSVREGDVVAAGHRILSGIDLTVEAGEHVAIVGPSGAGKSSVLGLLLGWHRLARGRLLVDGRPLRGEELERLRRCTAWVDPGIQLWNASLLDNLAYGQAKPDHQAVAAAGEAAELRDVMRRLPQGLQSALGEGGALVSGGEGQRVRFARALAQPGVRLALLDEPFRGLAHEQRRRLMAEARRHWQAATLLCVTHDLDETQTFDRVIVVQDGAIVEQGNPKLLALADSRYRDLLQAEARVQAGLRGSHAWERLRVEDGHVLRLS